MYSLTGKVKEDFNEWLKLSDWGGFVTENINRLPLNCIWGVYQDFFDSHEIDIMTRFKAGRFISYASPHKKTSESFLVEEHDTRVDSRLTAIRKAVEIYNSQEQ